MQNLTELWKLSVLDFLIIIATLEEGL